MHARIITLNCESQRVKSLALRLKQLARGTFKTVEPFSASDGRGLSPGEFTTSLTGPGKRYTPSVIMAIADSHMRAWNEAFSENDSSATCAAFFEEDAIVRIEDDLFFKERLDGALAEAKHAVADTLMLGCFSSSVFSFLIAMAGCMKPGWVATASEANNAATAGIKGVYTSSPKVSLGAHAYILYRSGYIKIIKEIRGNISKYIDHEIQTLSSRSVIQILCASPRLVFQTSTATAAERHKESVNFAKRNGINTPPLLESSAESSSAPNSFPTLISNFLDLVPIDKYVSARYVANVEIFEVSKTFSLTPMYAFIALVGLIYTIIFQKSITANGFVVSITPLFALYIMISIKDIAIKKHVEQFCFGAVCLAVGPMFFWIYLNQKGIKNENAFK